MENVNQAISSAVEAIQRGDFGQGRATLTWVLNEQPDNRLAWLWMACCVHEESERNECYRRASHIPS
jgi:Tfp pilus assembly protein PilF